MPGKDLDLLMFYRSEIKFESELLSGRLNSFIASQSFLVIAYAASISTLMGTAHGPAILVLPSALALLGLVLCLQALPGIQAAHAVIEQWHARQRELLATAQGLEAYRLAFLATMAGSGRGPVPLDRFKQGAVFARHTPWIFALTWCFFGVLPAVLFLTRE